MKRGKCQCSIFMDNYASFLEGKVDSETERWMEQHKKECIYCNKWAESFNGGGEHAKEREIEDTIDNKKRINTALAIGIAVVIFITFWMSTWFS